jgi:cell division transport system permease protein
MSTEPQKKITSRRFKPNHLFSIISTSLVLFMIGLLGLVFSSGNKLANQFKENLEFTVILKDNTDEKEIQQLKNDLEKKPWVKSAEYISKEEAAKIFTKETGEDFKDLLNYNPLFASINLKLYSAYTGADSVAMIEAKVLANKEVSEFYYERELVAVLNDNLRKVGWIIIGVSTLFLFVAITLIDSTVRLSMYANRFLIRSMQLVGATRSFVTAPFLKKSITNGLVASGVAIGLLLLLMNFAMRQIPELKALFEVQSIVLLFLGILLTGLFFSYLSTRFAVRKYLRMKIEELF